MEGCEDCESLPPGWGYYLAGQKGVRAALRGAGNRGGSSCSTSKLVFLPNPMLISSNVLLIVRLCAKQPLSHEVDRLDL